MTRHPVSSRRWTAALAGLAVLSTVALAPAAARADAGGIGFWLPGGMGSLAAVPGQPGWSLATIYLHVNANAGAGQGFSKTPPSSPAFVSARTPLASCPPTLLQLRCWADN